MYSQSDCPDLTTSFSSCCWKPRISYTRRVS